MAGPPYDPEEEMVCVCHEVKRRTIRQLAERYRSFDHIVQVSTICQTCQGCESEIRRILGEVLAGRPGRP